MNKKCNGCGAILQTANKDQIGYVNEKNLEKSNLCERCFRIRNYGDYKIVEADNKNFINILKDIDKNNDLVLLVVDPFNIPSNLNNIGNILSNSTILVVSKKDILPKGIYEQKILDYFNDTNLNIVDKVIISSKKNYNFDELLMKIHIHKKSNRVYVVGYTNSGKSSMINKLIHNYSNEKTAVTTSLLPSTTLNTLEVYLDDNLTLIDTPGILDDKSIINKLKGDELKKVVPDKEIKPITYQIKSKQGIIIDKYAYLDCKENTNITIFMSNKLKIDRIYTNKKTDKYHKHSLTISSGKDIVISGLCFIKVSKDCQIDIYTKDDIYVYLRDSLI